MEREGKNLAPLLPSSMKSLLKMESNKLSSLLEYKEFGNGRKGSCSPPLEYEELFGNGRQETCPPVLSSPILSYRGISAVMPVACLSHKTLGLQGCFSHISLFLSQVLLGCTVFLFLNYVVPEALSLLLWPVVSTPFVVEKASGNIL